MNRHRLGLAGGALIAGVLILAGTGFAYDIYTDIQNCQQMAARPNITANCGGLINQLFIAGGLAVGLAGMGLLALTVRWHRNRTEQTLG